MRTLILAFCSALLVSCASGGWQTRQGDGFGYRYKLASVDYGRLQEDVLAMPSARSEYLEDQIRVAVPAKKRIYLFTTDSHAAHPAMILMRVSDDPITRADGFAGGDLAAFEDWLKVVGMSRDQHFAAYRGGP